MTIRQLSIFIENQSGTLQKVLELIKQLRIQIIACTIADTAEYGIFRIICSEPDRACRELKAVGVAVAISDVFAVELDNQPGGAADVVGRFSGAGFKGACIALVAPEACEQVRQSITEKYLAKFPEYERTFEVCFCRPGDGARFVADNQSPQP